MIVLFRNIVSQSWFFIGYAVFLISLIIVVNLWTKEESLIYLHENWTEFQDFFFKYFTHLGDGITSLLVILLFFSVKIRYGVMAFCSFAGSALFTQLLKRGVFDHCKRPSIVLWDKFNYEGLHKVPGVELLKGNSYPSGHTTAAFSVFLLLAFISGKKSLGMVFFFCAALAGYSRVYLGQHFFEDVLLGSIIGTLFSLLSFSYFEGRNFGHKGLLLK